MVKLTAVAPPLILLVSLTRITYYISKQLSSLISSISSISPRLDCTSSTLISPPYVLDVAQMKEHSFIPLGSVQNYTVSGRGFEIQYPQFMGLHSL